MFRTDDGLELRPLGLELLLPIHLLPLGGLLEIRVDARLLALVEGEFGEPALVVEARERPRPTTGAGQAHPPQSRLTARHGGEGHPNGAGTGRGAVRGMGGLSPQVLS